MKAVRAWILFGLATTSAGITAAALAGIPLPGAAIVVAILAAAGFVGVAIARGRWGEEESVLPAALEASTLIFPPTSPAERRRR